MISIEWPSHAWWYGQFLPWLEPVATALAFLAAGVAVGLAWRSHRREIVKGEREQAEDVVVWWKEAVDDEGRDIDNGSRAALWYVNRSGLPIYNVHYRVQQMDVEITQVSGRTFESNRPLLEPCAEGQELRFQPSASRKWYQLQRSSPYTATAPPRVAIEFTDAADRRWVRGFDGRLERLKLGMLDRLKGKSFEYVGIENDPSHNPKLVAQWKRRFPPGSNLDNVSLEELQGIDPSNP